MFADEDWDEPRGCYPVCLDFGPDWRKIDYDTLVRCLCYIGRHAAEINPQAIGFEFEVIPMRWLHVGAAYPCLAMPGYQQPVNRQRPENVSFDLMEPLDEFIRATGMEKLADLSVDETMTWADIHRLHPGPK